MTKSNRNTLLKKPLLVEKIRLQMDHLKTQLKMIYQNQIKNIEQDIKHLSHHIKLTLTKRQQLVSKDAPQDVSLPQKLSFIDKKKLQGSLKDLDLLLKQQQSALLYNQRSLQYYRNELKKSKMEEQLLSKFAGQGIRAKNLPFIQNSHENLKSQYPDAKISFEKHLAIIHLSQPPLPTDGPDQPQSEADLAILFPKTLSDHHGEVSSIYPNFSPYVNYLVDDEVEDESEI